MFFIYLLVSVTGECLAYFLYQDFPFKEIPCVWLCVCVHMCVCMCVHTCGLKEEIKALDEPGLRKFFFYRRSLLLENLFEQFELR